MKTEQAKCAKQIREELKMRFPKIKFKVTSESFAGGNAVDIRWIDGPTTDEVNEIVKKYQYGYFDGMIDCYECNNFRDDIYQVKYVMTNRDYSQETYDFLKQKLGDNIVKKIYADQVWKEFVKTSFT